jgi:hypothetical protein
MNIFGINLFTQKREAKPTPPSAVPGVPSSTMEQEPSGRAHGGNYLERVVYASTPRTALTVSPVYQAIRLRGDVMGVMPVQ